jgi:hypothetical protein
LLGLFAIFSMPVFAIWPQKKALSSDDPIS